MKITVAVVGKAKGAVGEAIGEYEARTRRYLSSALLDALPAHCVVV